MICLPETVKKLKVKGDHVAMLPVASVLYVTGSKDDDGKTFYVVLPVASALCHTLIINVNEYSCLCFRAFFLSTTELNNSVEDYNSSRVGVVCLQF